MSHITYITSQPSRATIPEYQPFSDTKNLARNVTLCLRHREGFRVTSGLIFWYVTLKAMWYMYNIISLIRRRKYPFLCDIWMVIVLHLTKFQSPSPKDALCQVWLKLAVLEKKNFTKFCQHILLFRSYLLLGKGCGPPFEQIWIHITKGCFVLSLDEIGPLALEKNISKFRQCILSYFTIISPLKRAVPFIWINLYPHYPRMYFCYFVIISPWKRTWPFFWTYLNSHHLRMLYTKFGWIGLSGSGEKVFKFKLSTFFLLFPNYLPFGKGVAVHLKKSLSPRDTLGQVWLKLA